MSEVKVINLNNTKSKSKKNLYKEILSSSKTVKEIIKNKRFDYLNNYVKNNKLVNFNTPNSLPPLNKNVTNPNKKNESITKLRKSKSKENESQSKEENIKKSNSNIKDIFKQKENKKSPVIENKPEKIKKVSKRKTIVENIKTSSKKKQLKLENFDFKAKSKVDTFKKMSQEIQRIKNNEKMRKNKSLKKKHKILEIVKLLKQNRNNIGRVNFILKKLDKQLTIDLLIAFNLIKHRSKAPKKLLDTILINYITSNMVISHKK